MSTIRHLWAIGFDDPGRAEEVRDNINKLGRDGCDLTLKDVAVVVRRPCGSFTLDREPLVALKHFLDSAAIGFITGVVVASPLTGATTGAMVCAADIVASAALGIGDDFVRDVKELMKPGTSALFVLDEVGNMDNVLQSIRGLGGTVLRTNVDLEHAHLVQSKLAASSADPIDPNDRKRDITSARAQAMPITPRST
jgi:uncharacterized membrane protein